VTVRDPRFSKADQDIGRGCAQDDHVTTATDTFLAFVDVLAAALDDHEASAKELAARVHLSRFHFDRVIAAAAGEPPASLRRRVLLERAAYRLVSSDRNVLDIALEAGYASHEAFTRAFTRAFRATPAAWRRHPTQTQINAPSEVHFHPPGSLRLPAQRKVSSMDLLTRMIEHHVWLVSEMVGRAGTLKAAQLDAPIEISVEGVDDDPTLRSLLSRLIGQMAMWNAAVAGRPYDFAIERGESVRSMRSRMAKEGRAFTALVQEIVDQGRLDETFIDAICEPPDVFTYGGMIAHVLTFAAHRRTLVAGALIDAGVKDLGAGDPMRWVEQPA
jgi:AraC-like DNA-binding protein